MLRSPDESEKKQSDEFGDQRNQDFLAERIKVGFSAEKTKRIGFADDKTNFVHDLVAKEVPVHIRGKRQANE